MYANIGVCAQIGLMAAVFVAFCIWQWYVYRTNKRRPNCQDPGCRGREDRMSPLDSQLQAAVAEEQRCRFRELGIAYGGLPCGPHNAITDAGVRVGHSTVISGEGALRPGQGPARTGVTVILPHAGDTWMQRASAGSFVLNGNGSVTGLDWLRESGLLEGPIALTNTHSVGDVYSGLIRWMIKQHPAIGITDDTYLPVVGECDDSSLNDIQGFHVTAQHVAEALDSAASGPVREGAVGAGTGMTCYEFKGGIGTASRVAEVGSQKYTVGVLVNCNHGGREQLKIFGAPVGELLGEDKATMHTEGSICIIVATDAPLTSRQLDRLAKRAAMGLALTGSTANNSSGDFVVAFSTTRLLSRDPQDAVRTLPELADDFITPLFEATVQATEESILNALCAATTVVGRDGNVAPALPLSKTREILQRFGR